jgi:WD40 repeat protein
MLDDSCTDDGMADPDRISTRRDFARELSLIKERASLTVRDVARALATPASTVGGYFSGRYLPVQPPGMLRNVLVACGITDEADIQRWLAALGRVRRAPGRRPADAPAPYRGLESFQPEDADWFFGRRELTELLVGRLLLHGEQDGPLMVVGPSGSGKSSLLRAGLIPTLQGGALGEGEWPLALLTPGAHPVQELTRQLALARHDADDRLIIVVDQFEEVFTACPDEGERGAFIEALCTATAPVVVGLRADFYDRALRYPALVRALDQHQVLVGPMNTQQVRIAIIGPAVKAGLEIEDGLVEILLRDLGPATDGAESSSAHVPGALPLLSHALLATWEHSHGGRLTVADYLDSGGINGAVASSADKVYNELSPQQQDLARQIFIRLVHIADDTGDTRRRVPRSELVFPLGEPQVVLDSFIDNRLITAGTDDVEIAHDALLLAWPLLRGWIDSARAGVPIRRQLTAAAEDWRESDRDPELLYSGGRLAAAEDWAGQPGHAGDLNIPEHDFLDACIQRRQAEERTARHATGRLQLIAAALAALLLVAGVLAVTAYQQKNAATYQRDLAISAQVATDANQLRGTDIALAMQLSLIAYRVSPTAEALSSLLDSTATQAATRLLGTSSAGLQSVAFSPGDAMLATGGDDGAVRLWDVRQPGHPVLVGGPLAGPGIATSVAFSPDGKTLAVASSSGTVRLWNSGSPDRPILLDQLVTGPVNSVAFSPGGQMLAAGSADGRVFVWRAGHLSSVSAGVGAVNTVAFSADGRLLAAGGSTGRIRLWDVSGTGLLAGVSLSGPANGVNAVTFSPDSQMLAAGGNNSQVWLWRLGAGRPARLAPLTGPRSWIYSVAFSPSGTTIAAGSADNNAYVWDVADATLIAALPHPAPVLSVAFGHGGGELATADADGVARIWTLPGPVLTGPPGSIFTVAFSPDSRDLVSASALPSGQGALQLWSVADPGQPVALGAPLVAGTPDGTVAYGPGGRLAAGGGHGAILLWDVRDARQPVQMPSPPTALNSAIQYVAFSGNGQLMAAGSSAGQIELWDTADFGQVKPLAVIQSEAAGAYRDIYAVAFSPDDRLMASASADGTVRLWDIADPGRPRELGPPLARLGGAVFQVAFSPDGDVLAASGADGDVRLWDVSDRRLVAAITGPPEIVYDVAFSPDGRTLATADGDKSVALWDIANPASPVSIGSLTGPAGAVLSVAFSPTGDAIAAGSQDDTTRLWLASAAGAARYVCSISGVAITRAEWEQYLPELPYNPPCKS